jgi:hypothetical protein
MAFFPFSEESDDYFVILDLDSHASTLQKFLVTTEIDSIGDDDTGNPKLNDGSGAHQARAQARVQCRFPPTAE